MSDDTGKISSNLPTYRVSVESRQEGTLGVMLVIPPHVNGVAFGNDLQAFLNSRWPDVRIQPPHPI